ncbi:conjugal transfer protein TrbC (plasmid) [Afipia carboxidovorans OM5]|uniref:Conjugal transfer protein TrbC n=1 Tax=Afipia carboxidovorans (strain ATCC 49405 / DSM 1227 / KCTC 32145 / OM5) TaxID=504832 RepID=Q6LB34_AFIC5|nr:TrbC/VirB2 family protein [Afipia carboxidovorans]AEI04568.1 conjugal transfer protein TrbC [Afipia carboxidovorans OM4]AEI08197.1 conjugal transfer protein TrbC [Afipia carboxidovorans OM5]
MSLERRLALGFVTCAALVMATHPAIAGGGGGLPWEGPLQQIQQSITGPVAGFIALAAVAVAGGMLIFGGELNDFARRLMYVVLVAGILLGATQIVGLFGASGASIGIDPTEASSSESVPHG